MIQTRILFVLAILIVGGGYAFWSLRGTEPTMIITGAIAEPAGNSGSAYQVFLNLENPGGPDRLVSVRSHHAANAMVMGAVDGNVIIPSRSTPIFASDGAHIMVLGLQEQLVEGQFIPLTLAFEIAGEVNAKALVKTSGQAVGSDASADGGMTEHTMHQMGKMLEVDQNKEPPKLSMEITSRPDQDGWQITTATQNFTFKEPQREPKHIYGQGHAHLYLNGLKLQRMYTNSAFIGALPKGKHRVTVTLNTNDHQVYAIDGKPVTVSVEIKVK